jgi:hypothetical protein
VKAPDIVKINDPATEMKRDQANENAAHDKNSGRKLTPPLSKWMCE